MALPVYGVAHLIDWTVPGSFWLQAADLTAAMLAGGLAFAAAAYVIGGPEVATIGRQLRATLAPRAAGDAGS